MDQPRRGNAGRSTVEGTVSPIPDEQDWFSTFRLGIWPDYFPGVQFSKDPETLNQYFRSMTPNIGPIDIGGFVFPQGEVPAPIASSAGPLEAAGISNEEFLKLTKIPIIIYYGDYIPATLDPINPGADGWRARLEMAKLWRDAVNRNGGDVTVVHLPEIGIRGNTHFPFSDLNNVEIADLMSQWLTDKGLDR